MQQRTSSGINSPFSKLSQSLGQIVYVLRTRLPLPSHVIANTRFSFDLHVLTTPPAFTLSQDQTLHYFFIQWMSSNLSISYVIDLFEHFFKVF